MSIFGIFPQSHVTDKKLAGSIAFSILFPHLKKLTFLCGRLRVGPQLQLIPSRKLKQYHVRERSSSFFCYRVGIVHIRRFGDELGQCTSKPSNRVWIARAILLAHGVIQAFIILQQLQYMSRYMSYMMPVGQFSPFSEMMAIFLQATWRFVPYSIRNLPWSHFPPQLSSPIEAIFDLDNHELYQQVCHSLEYLHYSKEVTA